MPEPLYLLILAPWAPILVWALARQGFGRYGVIVHALALLVTLGLAHTALRLWLSPLLDPAPGAFSSVERIVLEVDHWWALYLYKKAWPVPALAYFVACSLLAVLLARRRHAEAERRARSARGSRWPA